MTEVDTSAEAVAQDAARLVQMAHYGVYPGPKICEAMAARLTALAAERAELRTLLGDSPAGYYSRVCPHLLAERDHLAAEVVRLRSLLRRPGVWAAHAADPDVVAPECDCDVGAVCQRKACCYLGEIVPPNVRSLASEPQI